MPVGPEAEKVKSATVAVPPLSFTPTLRSCIPAPILHYALPILALSAFASVMLEPFCVPPTHTHALAVYLPVAAADSVSDRAYVPAWKVPPLSTGDVPLIG